MRACTRILFVAGALFVAGCQPQLADRAIVDDLRVLGVRAEPPEAAPGATVAFDALVADPSGDGRAISYAWAICSPGDGGVGRCGDPANILALGSGLTATWTVPVDALSELDEESARMGIDVFVVLGIEVRDFDDPSIETPHDVAFKRVRISTNPAPNANPVLASFTVAGQSAPGAVTVATDAEHDLEARPGIGARENYVLASGAEAVEEARYTWLITTGSVGDAVSYGEVDANGDAVGRTLWGLPAGADAPATATVWVVLRDGRGGTSWATQQVIVQQ